MAEEHRLVYGVMNGFSLTLVGTVWPDVYGANHIGAISSAVAPLFVLSSATAPGLTGMLTRRRNELSDADRLHRSLPCGDVCGDAVLVSSAEALSRAARRRDGLRAEQLSYRP